MPADCVLSFEGGSISNGTLTGLNTVIMIIDSMDLLNLICN